MNVCVVILIHMELHVNTISFSHSIIPFVRSDGEGRTIDRKCVLWTTPVFRKRGSGLVIIQEAAFTVISFVVMCGRALRVVYDFQTILRSRDNKVALMYRMYVRKCAASSFNGLLINNVHRR